MTPDSPTILVVDDDPRYCNLLGLYIESEGFHVLKADSGRVGLQVLEEREPDVTLLDLKLNDIDGWTFYRQSRAGGYTRPIVIVSGQGAAKARRELGAEASLEKPFELEQAAEVVRAVL